MFRIEVILLICLLISFASSRNRGLESNINIDLVINGDPPVTKVVVTEPPVTVPPVTEPPVTELTVTEPPVTDPSVGFQRTGFIPGDYSPNDPAFVKDYHGANYGNRLPKNYDLRTIWNDRCLWMREIFDQGDCDSSWAVASANAIQDRICMSRTKDNWGYLASAAEFMNCIPRDGNGVCDGGETLEAFRYFANKGIVTGGPYEFGNTCKPYQISPTVPSKGTIPTNCPAKCTDPKYSGTYEGDNIRGRNIRRFQKGKDIVQDIQWEIFLNGPVVAGFDVYDSFFYFWNHEQKDVVYRAFPGEQKRSHHAVRLVGWGTTDNGTDYWIFLNSWGNDTLRQGQGRFLRGSNECGIEDYVTCADVV